MKAIHIPFSSGISWLAIAFALLMTSCASGKTDEVKNMVINTEDIQDFPISKYKTTQLETSDSCLCSDIMSAQLFKGRLLIYTNNSVYAFDPKTGKFLTKYGREGQGPGEYGSLASVFTLDNNVILFDMGVNIARKYTVDGKYLDKTVIKPDSNGVAPIVFVPIGRNKIIVNNCYQGFDNYTPSFGLLNDKLEYVRLFDNMYMIDGFNRYDYLKSDGEYILFAPTFEDEIYRLDADGLRQEYTVSFPGEKIPADVKKQGFVATYKWIFKPENFKYIGNILNCKESKSQITFTLYCDGKYAFAVYDKASGKCTVRKLIYDDEATMVQQIIVYADNGIYLFFESQKDLDKNPQLMFIPYSDLGVK